MTDNKKWIKFLMYGMIGAVLTMIGDYLLLGVDTREAAGTFGQYIVSAEKVSYTRIGLAGSFGYVGIPLIAFGFYVLYLMSEEKNSILARLYRASVYGYIAFGGAIHIICCYLLTGMKKDLETGISAEGIMTAVLAEQGGYIVPCFIVFFIFYFMNVITMILLIIKKKTCLPGWMWIINPLTFKILFNAIGKLGDSAFLNGLACSNMSLGGLLILLTWMVCIKKSWKSR